MQEMSFKITKLKVNTRWICNSSFDSCSENISSRTDNLFCFEDLQGNLYRLGAALNTFFVFNTFFYIRVSNNLCELSPGLKKNNKHRKKLLNKKCCPVQSWPWKLLKSWKALVLNRILQSVNGDLMRNLYKLHLNLSVFCFFLRRKL